MRYTLFGIFSSRFMCQNFALIVTAHKSGTTRWKKFVVEQHKRYRMVVESWVVVTKT